MSYEPEILVSEDRSVLQQFANAETLVACWDASNDPGFAKIFQHIRTFNQSAHRLEEDLAPVEAYAEAMLKGEIDPIIDRMELQLKGYDPLHSWIVESDRDICEAETIPHRDHRSIGIFFYFNEEADLGTFCIPNQYAGKDTGGKTYPHADMSKAIVMPSRGVALIDLGNQTHYGPSHIPSGACRVVSYARYDNY